MAASFRIIMQGVYVVPPVGSTSICRLFSVEAAAVARCVRCILAISMLPMGCTRQPTAVDLFEAVRVDDASELERLLSRGADVNAKDKNGETLLCLALWQGSEQAFSVLLEHGVDVDLEGQIGTPLAVAVQSVYSPMRLQLLIDKGAQVDGVREAGLTPLHYAAAHLNLEAAELLLSNGASRTARTARGDTPHDLAVEALAEDRRYRTSSAKQLIPGISDLHAAALDRMATQSREHIGPEALRQLDEDYRHLVSLLEPREE